MNFDPQERTTLAALADLIIPAGNGFPSASQADVADAGLDQVLAFRPDLGTGLKAVLASAAGHPAVEVVANLRANDPADFGVLTEFVSGAYFLNPQVRRLLGYEGQRPRLIDVGASDLDPTLLQPVIGRGPIYRPTPGMEQR